MPAAPRAIRCCSPPSRRSDERDTRRARAAQPALRPPGHRRARLREAGDRKLAEIGPAAAADAGEASEATTVRWRRPAIFSSRAARLTAGPMQVKSSRLPPPILPYRMFPTCSATPKRKRSMVSPIGYCIARRWRGLRARLPARGRRRARIAVIFRDRKHREQPVAHEFQYLAAMAPDRRHLAIEIVVENVDHGLRRQPVRQRGKAAQIRQPDRRMHRIGMAAANLAAEDALAGAVADIGVEQDRGGAAQADDLDQPRQRRHERSQRGQLVIAEAAGLLAWSSSMHGSCRR